MSGRARSIENVAEVLIVGLLHTQGIFLLLGREVGSHSVIDEVLEIDRNVVLRILLDRGVKDNDFLERTGNGDDTERRVVLLLFTDKQDSHLRVIEHVGHLRTTAGRIERDGHHPDAIGTEINEK